MKSTHKVLNSAERHQELLALLNMVSYAIDIAQSAGASATASHMKTARKSLVAELQEEFGQVLSHDAIDRLATTRAGHC